MYRISNISINFAFSRDPIYAKSSTITIFMNFTAFVELCCSTHVDNRDFMSWIAFSKLELQLDF